MNIESMRAFLEIASVGSFQTAAERLHITQSGISARIKTLERRMNRQLFVRKRSGLELTDAGQRFLRHAQNCVESWEHAQREIALPEVYDDLVSLGIQINYWQRLVIPWTHWMERHAKQTATRIVSDHSERLLSLLRDGMLDLAVVYSARQSGNLVIETLWDESLILVSTTPRALNTGWTPGYVFVDWADEFLAEHNAAFPDSPPPRLSSSSAAVALAHVLEHGGSGYFSEREVRPHLETQRLHRVPGAPEFSRTTYLVYPKHAALSQSLQRAIEGVRAIEGSEHSTRISQR